MIRIEAVIKLFKCATLPDKNVPTGFQITIRAGDKGYYAQLFSVDGNAIPLEEEITVFINIVYGELDIEKFLKHSSFEFVSWEKLGEGYTVGIKKVDIEQDALKEVGKERQEEILSIIQNLK